MRRTEDNNPLAVMALLRSIAPLFLLVTVLTESSGAKSSSACTHEMDLAFLVDSSGSICNDEDVKTCANWKACIAFIHTIVNDMIIGKDDVRVALTIFQSKPYPQWNLLTYSDKSSLLKAIDNLGYSGGTTDTISALDTLSTTFRPENGDRPNVRNVVMLVTDGIPRIDDYFFPMEVIRAAVKRVTDQGIRLLAIGVTDNIDIVTLKELSSLPHKMGENVFFAKDYQNLQTILRELENQNCIAIDQPPPPAMCQQNLYHQMDVAFVVDSSGSICDDPQTPVTTCDDWKACVAFIHAIVNDMTIGPKDFRVALILFDTEVYVKWNLKTYSDKSSLLKAIDDLEFKGGTTNTTGALDTLSTIFRIENGDRPLVRNTAILITDGKPKNWHEFVPMNKVRASVKRVTAQEIRLMAVGVTDRIDMDTLKELSSPPHKVDENVFVAKDYQSLQKILRKLEIQNCMAVPVVSSAAAGRLKPFVTGKPSQPSKPQHTRQNVHLKQHHKKTACFQETKHAGLHPKRHSPSETQLRDKTLE